MKPSRRDLLRFGAAGAARNRRDRREVGRNVEIEIAIKCLVPRLGRGGQQQRISVGRRFGDVLGGERASRARPVLDDKLLAKVLRKPLRNQPRIGVGYAAQRKAGPSPWAS